MKQPIISIVIANFNYGHFLSQAIESVINQDSFEECELIVVDGASKDESVNVIKRYSDKLAWWCSEPDKGQSDAFNKGFSHAKGKLGCWLNADDIMISGTLRAVLERVKQDSNIEWLTGGTVYIDKNSLVTKAVRGTWITKNMHKWVDPTVIGGPSSFFSLKRLSEVGGFDVRLRYTMDCDLWNKFFAAGVRMIHLNKYMWGFRIHEDSKTSHALVGKKNIDFIAEDKLVFKRSAHILKGKVGQLILRIFKLLNLTILNSAIDTFRFKGKHINEVN